MPHIVPSLDGASRDGLRYLPSTALAIAGLSVSSEIFVPVALAILLIAAVATFLSIQVLGLAAAIPRYQTTALDRIAALAVDLRPSRHPVAGLVAISVNVIRLAREDLHDRAVRLPAADDLHRSTAAIDDARRLVASCLDEGSAADLRFELRRLRRRSPDVPLLVGAWWRSGDDEADAAAAEGRGAVAPFAAAVEHASAMAARREEHAAHVTPQRREPAEARS